MVSRPMTIREIGLVAATRGLGGIGAGLLLAGLLADRQRKRVGASLLALGALTTVPLIIHLLRKPTLTTGEQELELKESVVD